MTWGDKAAPLEAGFRGGKFVPRDVRPISVPLTERDDALFDRPQRDRLGALRTAKLRTASSQGLERVQSRAAAARQSLAAMRQDFANAISPPRRAIGPAPEASKPAGHSVSASKAVTEEQEAELALQAVQGSMAEESVEEEYTFIEPGELGLLQRRRLVVEVRQAVNLPIMDDEPGMTCDPYVVLQSCGREAKTRHIHRTLDPEWQEKHTLELPLGAEDEKLTVTVMDYDDSADDKVGTFVLPLGSKSDPFPTVAHKYVNHRISMHGVLSTATFEGWYELESPDGETVRGMRRQTSLIHLHFQHVLEIRDVSFRPTPEFMHACGRAPGVRSRRDVELMTREVVTQLPASALLSSRIVSSLCAAGQLKEWKKHDVVQLQHMSPLEDALHLVLSGTFFLYAQAQGANAAMYRMLKGRSFGPQTAFGPQIGQVGPGEGFGEAALYMHDGVSSTSVCMSDSGGMTLMIDRRQCERILEQFFRKEAGYSPTMHGALFQEHPKNTSTISTLSNYLKQFENSLFSSQHVTDDFLRHVLEQSKMVKLKAGDMVELQGDCEEVYLVCYGTLSAHACLRSIEIRHRMPIAGECIDLLGPGSTFGACGYVGASIRAREHAEVLKINRTALIQQYCPQEPFLPETLKASQIFLSQQKDGSWKGGEVDNKSSQFQRGPSLSSHPPYRHPQQHQRHVQRNSLLQAMHSMQWLRGLSSLKHLSTEMLWFLVQNISIYYLDCTKDMCIQDCAVVVDGVAQIKETVSAEKPAREQFIEAGRGALIRPGSRIIAGCNRDSCVTAVMWPSSAWEFALGQSERDDSCRAQLTLGGEIQSHSTAGERCRILKTVPLLASVPDKVLEEHFVPHLRCRRLPDNAIITTDGEEDVSLYIIVKGSVLVFDNRDSEDLCLTASSLGLDHLQTAFGYAKHEHGPGECFGQVELMMRCTNTFSALCKGPCEILLLDREAINNQEIESMIWLNLNSSPACCREHPEFSGASSAMESEGESRMEREIRVLKTYMNMKTHKICAGLSARSAIFLCAHLRKTPVQKDDQVHLRTERMSSILALIKGSMMVSRTAIPPAKNVFGAPLCSLCAGDVYDPTLAKMAVDTNLAGVDSNFDHVAVAKEDSECYLVDAGNFRTAIKKNMLDSAVHARAYLKRQPLFSKLPAAIFDKLSKIARVIHCIRDEEVYCSTLPNDNVLLLVDGDFKITKKRSIDTTISRLGPGMHFGSMAQPNPEAHAPMDTVRTRTFSVFATTASVTIQLPVKELSHLLSDDISRRLQKQLADDFANTIEKIRSLAEREAAAQTHSGSPTMSSPKKALADSHNGIPARKIPKGMAADEATHQTTYCSARMTLFFENVANGKVIPEPGDDYETKEKVGRPPEEILPSLQHVYLQRKLNEISRKSNLDFLKPQGGVSDLLTTAQLAAREAKLVAVPGIARLQLLQDRLDQTRANENMRHLLAERATAHKRDIVASRMGRDSLQLNKKRITDKTLAPAMRAERLKKEEQFAEARAANLEKSEKEWEVKIEKTMRAMNRKDLNDENHVEHLRMIQEAAALKRRVAIWLMVASLGARMHSWSTIFVTVRGREGLPGQGCRSQLLLYSAAAVTLQRQWRVFMQSVVEVRRESAAIKISGCFRKYQWKMRHIRRAEAAPIITTFLRELVLSMQGTVHHFRMFLRKVIHIQRAWRRYRRMAEIWYQDLLGAWNKCEPKFRKDMAAQSDSQLPVGRMKAAPPPPQRASRSAPKIPSIPAEIKWARIVKYVRHARQLHREKKTEWRGQLESWSKREHNRRMVQAQKDLLNREFDNTSKSLLHTMGSGVNAPDAGLLATYARDDARLQKLLFMNPLRPLDDPPPPAPIFGAVPSESNLRALIRMAHDDSIAASRQQRAALGDVANPPAVVKKK